MKRLRRRLAGALTGLLVVLPWIACGMQQPEVMIGVAWVPDSGWEHSINACIAIEEAGGVPVLLGQVRSDALAYGGEELAQEQVDEHGMLTPEVARLVKQGASNAPEVMQDVSAVVFAGGEDISPSLYARPAAWHGIEAETNYNAVRDVSDYLLMDYCFANDIPVLGLCRGMQMMAVVSGAEMIQDIPSYFAGQGKQYGFEHRSEPRTPGGYSDYAVHDVQVTKADSLLSRIAAGTILTNVPSRHHQAVAGVEGTPLAVTGVTQVCGEEMIEAVERTDMRFALGVQFHPEAAVTRKSDGQTYMDCETALRFFSALVQAACP